MKKVVKALIVAGMLIIPALSYLDDYHDPNDHSKYYDHGWIIEQQRQQGMEYEQRKAEDQVQMDALEKVKRQTQSFENQENIMNELRGTEAESQDSYDPVCPDFGCG
ncbi:MAG: hypothetical protein JRE65_06980 [Deltaproteobacteria bacterium]|jgi:hypothetical protein|nr:hypothetical protein [Deltaproteobacteria bacterium]